MHKCQILGVMTSALVWMSCSGPGPGPIPPQPQTVTHQLCIRNFEKIVITDGDADNILERATSVLNDRINEACFGVALHRQNAVSPYRDEFPRSLAAETDFDDLTEDGCVKVVERITWCGGSVPLNAAILGCAPVPGQGMVVVRTVPGQPDDFNKGVEPITWLHEFGHTRGLPHNSLTSLAVMAPGIGPEYRHITLAECAVYKGLRTVAGASSAAEPQGVKPLILPAQGGESKSKRGDRQASPGTTKGALLPVEEFVTRPFPSGLPVEQAKLYVGEQKKVEAMLLDPKFAPYRHNIIGLLGVIGTPETISLLKRVIETPVVGPPTDADIAARLAAPLAIGTIASRFNLPEKEVDLLRKSADPDYWLAHLAPAMVSSGNARHSLPANEQSSASQPLDQSDIDALSRDLAIQSYRGYAISGSKEAHEKLQQDKEGTANAALPAKEQKRRLAIINEAIRMNETSREKGALEIFKQ